MADFLLELLSEEIPARMQAKAREDLARLFSERIADAGLRSEAIETYATPRRLALIARALPAETEAVSEERRGPRADAPAQAIDGFLKSAGLTRDQLEERDDKKGRILFAVVRRPGRSTADVLTEAVPDVIRAFPWPKSMRWGEQSASTESLRWVRPLQGIVALLGEEIVPFEIAGVRSSAATLGHRFHHPGIITIGSANDYVEKLRACHVIIDRAEREMIIRDGAARLAADAGLTIVPDQGLVAENAGLTEWPVPLLGRFAPEYLDVPSEVIQLTMRTNQKYFACSGPDGKLAPNFICVANIEAADGGTAIASGNERVLAARLADAKFFWEQDLKVPLEEQAKKLDQIIFHEKLGTVAERVERIANIAQWFVANGVIDHSELAEVEQAARLSKADLVTGMVGEFPELQGVIGGYLARAQGHADTVADAVKDHYLPGGQADAVPTAPVTMAIALAEKLDTIVQFFNADLRPSGSRDPFALRRAAIGVIRIVLGNGLRFSLSDMVANCIGDRNAVATDVLDFFADRLKVQQREAGVRYDLIDAVFALGGEDDLVRLIARVRALQNFVETAEGADLLTGYKRAANILKRESWIGEPLRQPPSYRPEVEEAAVIAAIDSAEPKAEAAIEAEDFEAAMAALASLRAPVDAFFDKVTVNDPDPVKRATRLALLGRMRDAMHRVADFSKIEG